MWYDKLTIKAQEAVQLAQRIATQRNHQDVDVEHALLALLQQPEGIVVPILQKLGAHPDTVQQEVDAAVNKIPAVYGANVQRSLAPRLAKILTDTALNEAERLKDEYVSTEHMLIVFADNAGGAAQSILNAHAITRDAIFQVLQNLRGGQRITDQNPEEKYQALSKFSRDLTDLARKGKLDPVIGRDEEIRRVMQVLSRRTKNNPVLIGEPGVGKPPLPKGWPAGLSRAMCRKR